jgi:hypothetical protein
MVVEPCDATRVAWWVQGSGFECSGFRVWVSGFRVWSLEFRVEGLSFRM